MRTSIRSRAGAIVGAACIALLGACSDGGADEGAATSAEELDVTQQGGGAGPAVWDANPCDDPHGYATAHGYNFMQIAAGAHAIHGTAQKDLIVGTDGDDTIFGDEGDDIVCALHGEDLVYGDNGDDYIDGGGDNDTLYGGGGADVIHGRGGSDHIFGGIGDDLLFGDILDDHLFGDSGDDLLIGGHGTDVLMGGTGNDYLRGDTGNDAFLGGIGTDVASFATAMPPGQFDKVGAAPSRNSGVKVDFTDDCKSTGFASDDLGGITSHDGCANGDGGNEPLDGVEIVVGSPYGDDFLSGSHPPKFIPGFGDDRCDGNACGSPIPNQAGKNVFVAIDDTARDAGLILVGTGAADSLEVFAENHEVHVHSVSATPLSAGPGCHGAGDAVVCGTTHTLRYIAGFMDGGADVVKLGAAVAPSSQSFPRDFTAHVSGGDASDWLHGGAEEDVFFTGPTGEDHLYGNGGDDALLSESRKWPKMDCSKLSAADQAKNPRCDEDKPDAAHYTDGRDELYGGDGDDQLVTDYPCGNHLNSGGAGRDIAGFARSGSFNLTAQFAGGATIVKDFQGRAFNPQLCSVDSGTHLVDDLEIMEASDGDDELWGNDEPNTIWARKGDDHLHGLGGDDVLEGLLGDDWLYGGAGNDKLIGAAGNNHLFPDAN